MGAWPDVSARFAGTEDLARPLSPEDAGVQSMQEARPTKWHLGAQSWLRNLSCWQRRGLSASSTAFRHGHGQTRYYKRGRRIVTRAPRAAAVPPSLEEVRAYRSHVDEAMLRASIAPCRAGRAGFITAAAPGELILTDIKHDFWMNRIRLRTRGHRRSEWSATRSIRRSRGASTREQGGDSVRRARAPAASHFAFDNEWPRHAQLLQPHALASRW